MKKIPFDVKFRPQIESGECKVVTGDDRPVRIISWDKKVYGGRFEIVALVPTSQGDTEAVQLYCPDGTFLAASYNEKFKLFIVTPEPELTEFEEELYGLLEEICSFDELFTCDELVDYAKKEAPKLLSIARKQIEKECWDKFQKATNSELDWIAAIPDSVKYDEGWKDGYRLGKYEGGRNALKQIEAERRELESEDEKIRKALIEGMRQIRCKNGITQEQMIAYLEKQKEKEPAEWNDEDEDMLNRCISSIDEAKENRYAYKETDGDTSYDEEINWLKSLRSQPKLGWSAKDKQMLSSIQNDLVIIANESGEERREKYLQKAQFIEELFGRPQIHWKPSEEQMTSLSIASECVYADVDRIALESLYNDLKRLM